MDDYISREAVKELVRDLKKYKCTIPCTKHTYETVGVDDLLELIDFIPSADVVEVVRCKDCIHHDDCICVVCEEGETVVCKRESRHVRKDFSCIYGERRSE